MNVNQITEQLHLSHPAVSHHLKLMLDKQLLKVTQIGKERYYAIHLQPTLEQLQALTEVLAEDEAMRRQQLAG